MQEQISGAVTAITVLLPRNLLIIILGTNCLFKRESGTLSIVLILRCFFFTLSKTTLFLFLFILSQAHEKNQTCQPQEKKLVETARDATTGVEFAQTGLLSIRGAFKCHGIVETPLVPPEPGLLRQISPCCFALL